MRAGFKPQGKAMYVAPQPDKGWLLTEQRKLYTRGQQNPDYVFRKLWGLLTDPRNLRTAIARVASNRGRRTAGVDGITVRMVLAGGVDAFVEELRSELRAGEYRPSPVRRVLIPKPGQPLRFRPLGIPTVKDRVVQAAMKSIMEPIFEADFYPSSYGFRPGKGVHWALEHLRMLLQPKTTSAGAEAGRRLPYQWAIEGDIKGCFDNINHHLLMVRVRRRIGDRKLTRLVLAFLKSGVLSEEQLLRTDSGTPQGGILSPLLANIALSAIDERYTRHVWPRRKPRPLVEPGQIRRRAEANRSKDRRAGRAVLFPIRYADDFIILVGVAPGPREDERARDLAMREKADLAAFLKEHLGLELSEAKTLVTPVTAPMLFLGHHVRVRSHPTHGKPVSAVVIPKERSQRLRRLIREYFRRPTLGCTLEDRLQALNRVLRGWSAFYRHAWGAKRVFSRVDHYVWWTIHRWLRKKHPDTPMKTICARYGWRKPRRRTLHWRDGSTVRFETARVRVGRFRPWWSSPAAFAQHTCGEPDA